MTPSAKLGLSVLVVAAVLTPILWFVSPSPLRPADATTPPSTAFTPAPSAGAPYTKPAPARRNIAAQHQREERKGDQQDLQHGPYCPSTSPMGNRAQGGRDRD